MKSSAIVLAIIIYAPGIGFYATSADDTNAKLTSSICLALTSKPEKLDCLKKLKAQNEVEQITLDHAIKAKEGENSQKRVENEKLSKEAVIARKKVEERVLGADE